MSNRTIPPVMVALDFPDKETALTFLKPFDAPIYAKVGMELYYGEGPAMVRDMVAMGHQVFLDLKLHDIPNTVRQAMAVLGGLGVSMTNVHAAGTKAMMEAAKEGLAEGAAKAGFAEPALIAVTQLTSTAQEQLGRELMIQAPMEDVVLGYADLAKQAGLDGVVCSPWEAAAIHDHCGLDFLTVTPGIRPAGSATEDQHRIATPEKAKELGSDFIVVGRPITRAEDPVAAYETIVKDFAK